MAEEAITPLLNTSHALNRELSKSESAIRSMFDSIACRYDLANSLLSLGLHKLWKKIAVSTIQQGEHVLDVCTGTGDLIELIEKRGADVVGTDTSFGMLTVAAKRFPNRAMAGDATNLPYKDQVFDAVTVSFGIRNVPRITQALREFSRVLKPDGKLFILEFGQPRGVWGGLYTIYSRFIIPLIGGFITKNYGAYKYLPETSAVFPCGKRFIELVESNGFKKCSSRKLSGGVCYLYEALKGN